MTRQVELRDVFDKYLSLDPSDLTIVNSENLKDGWHLWDTNETVKVLEQFFCSKTTLETSGEDRPPKTLIVTFDNYGVSGHPNHISVHNGVVKFYKTTLETSGKDSSFKLLTLTSKSIFLKYFSPLDFVFTVFSEKLSVVLDIGGPKKTYLCTNLQDPLFLFNGMRFYKSQNVWFRKLFSLFSTYAYLNELLVVE